jgi:predicted DNA-binding transcriptional regulator YafY
LITTTGWVNSQTMAAQLGVSLRTLYRYMKERPDLFIQGRHYRRQTPYKASAWLWDAELADKAWKAEITPTNSNQ